MLQFGKEARLFDGNPVFKEEYRVRDVSPDALPGDQTPADTDMSLITFSIYAIRLLKTPELDTKAALWRQDGEWIVLERKESGIKELEYLPNQRPGLKTIAGIDAYRPRNLDGVEMPLVVLANGMDPHKSRGIGLFIPNIGQNLKQIAGFDRETGELLYTEDRRLGGWFHLNWARGPHIMLVPRTTVLGMLAPGRAMPNAIETLYSEVYLLFGSPEEILQAARHIEQGG
ncbi:MAG: hypothetical protein BWZ10_03053 [candidate division BRC1 bacterium ADurb.BinA364]|nr:MAG: hypothetical protein BWZ10_03053 [candidate division BRC1 bacterium ADurb.BinA364]